MYYPVLERTIYCTQHELFTFYLLVSSSYVCFLAELNTTRTMDDDRSLAQGYQLRILVALQCQDETPLFKKQQTFHIYQKIPEIQMGKINTFYLTQVPIPLGFYSTLSHLLSFLHVYMTRSYLIRPLSISKFSSGETGLPFQKFHLFRKVCIIYINRNFPIVLLTEKRPIKSAIMSVLKWLVLGLN